jgi:hypothetical protein
MPRGAFLGGPWRLQRRAAIPLYAAPRNRYVFARVYRQVDPESVVNTVGRLRDRVHERFPESSLAKVASELLEVARTSAERARWTAQPLISLRIVMGALLLLIAVGLVASVVSLSGYTKLHQVSAFELVQAIEAGVNDLVFVGVAVFFLASLESRIKRSRMLTAIHELRSLAHIIDMHQLTKSPERVLLAGPDTASSPERALSPFELSRYLDYCSEMLSLLGKIAALYAQVTTDTGALTAVDQIEDLTSGLSRKIWQKLMILHRVGGHDDDDEG